MFSGVPGYQTMIIESFMRTFTDISFQKLKLLNTRTQKTEFGERQTILWFGFPEIYRLAFVPNRNQNAKRQEAW
jgi:hypothetical protein